jgi:hypothetical protein
MMKLLKDPRIVYITILLTGILQAGANNFREAKSDFETCVQLDPNAGELRIFLG